MHPKAWQAQMTCPVRFPVFNAPATVSRVGRSAEDRHLTAPRWVRCWNPQVAEVCQSVCWDPCALLSVRRSVSSGAAPRFMLTFGWMD